MLCKQVQSDQPSEIDNVRVVFISNANRTVPLWKQKAAKSADLPVVWVGRYVHACITLARFHVD